VSAAAVDKSQFSLARRWFLISFLLNFVQIFGFGLLVITRRWELAALLAAFTLSLSALTVALTVASVRRLARLPRR
jgi:hypothetical protein